MHASKYVQEYIYYLVLMYKYILYYLHITYLLSYYPIDNIMPSGNTECVPLPCVTLVQVA